MTGPDAASDTTAWIVLLAALVVGVVVGVRMRRAARALRAANAPAPYPFTPPDDVQLDATTKPGERRTVPLLPGEDALAAAHRFVAVENARMVASQRRNPRRDRP